MPSATSPAPYNTNPAAAASQPATHPDIPPFPSEQTFSLLPDIHHLLSRVNALLLQQQQYQHSNTATSTSPAGAADLKLTAVGAGAGADATSTTHPPDLETLEIKDLPKAIYPLKQKLQRAREAIAGVPSAGGVGVGSSTGGGSGGGGGGMVDVNRSVAEQEREIKELEARCAALRARLGELASRAGAGGGGEAVDGGSMEVVVGAGRGQRAGAGDEEMG